MSEEAIQKIDNSLWVATRPFQNIVGDIGCRMTILGLEQGLFLHSPVPLDPTIKTELDKLGKVKWIVGPSKVHHLYIDQYISAYPDAQVLGAPGLAKKRKDLRFDGEINGSGTMWRDELELHLFQGAPMLNEVVVFHRASRTIIFTDLVFNVRSNVRNKARFFHWVVGATNRFGPHRLVRIMIRDRAAARNSVQRILEWDFVRVIPSHGEVLETGGHGAVEQAFEFLQA